MIGSDHPILGDPGSRGMVIVIAPALSNSQASQTSAPASNEPGCGVAEAGTSVLLICQPNDYFFGDCFVWQTISGEIGDGYG